MKNFKAKLFGMSLLVLALSACNHDFEKGVPQSPPEKGDQKYKTPKVLYIIADGARGTQVRDADIPTLKSLLPNAIYSWNSLADVTQTDATNWADMITGVKKEKHNVLTEDFAGNNLATYKTIFERIKSVNANMRIAAFSSSIAFKTNLTAGTSVSENLANDEAVKTRMVDFVKTDAADFIVGEFSGIEKAGVATSFDNNAPGSTYKAAINTFDTQLGAILTSLKSRATYKDENWLVIVSSNRGGPFTLPVSQDDRTIFSNTNANTFTIINNASYNPTFIAKPFVGNSYVGNAVEFVGNPKKGVARVSSALSPFFNFGDTSGFTISVKIKKHKNLYNVSRGDYYYQWPSFLGKKGAGVSDANPATGWGGGNGNRGWDFCLFRNGWRFFISGDKDFVAGPFKNGEEVWAAEFSGDTWHDLTAVVERRVDGVKQVRLYTDGIPGITNKNSGSFATPSTQPFVLGGSPNFDNNSILRMGWVPGEMDGGDGSNTFGAIDVELKELKIFRAALPDAVVRQYACDQSIDRSHPYFNYLIGYWPVNEGSGTTLADKGPLLANMTLSATQTDGYKWTSFTDLICSPASTNLSLLVPKNSDIPSQILSWFNVPRQAAWALDGKVWIAN
jgi:hypothetical protein